MLSIISCGSKGVLQFHSAYTLAAPGGEYLHFHVFIPILQECFCMCGYYQNTNIWSKICNPTSR
jgi:hypothetical protein